MYMPMRAYLEDKEGRKQVVLEQKPEGGDGHIHLVKAISETSGEVGAGEEARSG